MTNKNIFIGLILSLFLLSNISFAQENKFKAGLNLKATLPFHFDDLGITLVARLTYII